VKTGVWLDNFGNNNGIVIEQWPLVGTGTHSGKVPPYHFPRSL
jgi:hypothetical protein